VLDWERDSLTKFDDIDSLIFNQKSSELNLSKDSLLHEYKSKTVEQVESFKQPKAIKLLFAYRLYKDGIKFVDARSPEEFAINHIKGAINIPFYGSENYTNTINQLDKNDFLITYCSSAECDISSLSGDELFKMGFKKVYVFIGGFDEWSKNNYPTSNKVK
jgi:rhodanese-related sulfurtransferase